MRLVKARVLQREMVVPIVDINAPIDIELEFLALREVHNLVLGVTFYDSTGLCLFQTTDWTPNHLRPGRYRN